VKRGGRDILGSEDAGEFAVTSLRKKASPRPGHRRTAEVGAAALSGGGDFSGIRRAGIPAVLVGGTVVEFYTRGLCDRDIDMFFPFWKKKRLRGS